MKTSFKSNLNKQSESVHRTPDQRVTTKIQKSSTLSNSAMDILNTHSNAIQKDQNAYTNALNNPYAYQTFDKAEVKNYVVSKAQKDPISDRQMMNRSRGKQGFQDQASSPFNTFSKTKGEREVPLDEIRDTYVAKDPTVMSVADVSEYNDGTSMRSTKRKFSKPDAPKPPKRSGWPARK